MTRVHTLIIGSGAAGLNAALQCHHKGIRDLLIITEGLTLGTSINTGSDKQTYYKLSMCGADTDAPTLMAETYLSGGSMHGDLALVEAALSARAFLHLVQLGIPFPQDRYGQFTGYKTDHDPRRRATSIGPYTSREMCRALISEVQRREIPVREHRVVVSLLTTEEKGEKRAVGAVALDENGDLELFETENIILAAGGPGGLYRDSVYPAVHTGAIGVALMAGAAAQNLPESQYGLASIKYRWNVSGTYMQAIPRFISTAADGVSDEREFMREYFDSPGTMNSMVFLKGYQWPFDARNVIGGSSLVDLLVYNETVLKRRRVFLDFRRNPSDFNIAELSQEARSYLTNSSALEKTPLARLQKMNPPAVEHYRAHGLDIAATPLEIAVCAQHNNGGLASNLWWESINIKHLFPIGEINGSHGVYRPGGSALNAGQVGGFRAADYIAARYGTWSVSAEHVEASADQVLKELSELMDKQPETDWRAERREFQDRMSRAGAHIRSRTEIEKAVVEARAQWKRLETAGCGGTAESRREALRNRQLCFAHTVYLDAIKFAIDGGVGSRGSALVLDPAGTPLHPLLNATPWSIQPEALSFRNLVMESIASRDGSVRSLWVRRRPLPESESWFETVWAACRNGEIYDSKAEGMDS